MSDAETRLARRTLAGSILNRFRIVFSNAGVDREVSQENPMPVAIVSGSSGGGGAGDASAANQLSLLTLVGAVAEAAPASDIASSGVNGRLQRIAQRLSSIIALFPTAMTTRQYGPGYRAALATGAVTTFALTGNLTLGATREVRIRASSALWLRFGTSGSGQDASIPAANGPALSMPFDANQAEVVVVPAGTTHISVIAESAAGGVTFSPVA